MEERPLSMNTNEDPTIVKLSPDNKAIVEQKYGELNNSLQMLIDSYNKGKLEEGFKKTLLIVSEHYLMDLLKAFGHEGVIKKEHEERYQEIRSLHSENRELRKQLGEKISSEDVREKLKNLSEIIGKWWRKDGFGHVSDIRYLQYGQCKVKLSCHMFGDFHLLDDKTPVSSKKKKKDWIQELKDLGFEIFKESSHDFQVVDNDKNRELIRKIIKDRFPSAFATNFENWHSRDKPPIIRDVTIMIENLEDI